MGRKEERQQKLQRKQSELEGKLIKKQKHLALISLIDLYCFAFKSLVYLGIALYLSVEFAYINGNWNWLQSLTESDFWQYIKKYGYLALILAAFLEFVHNFIGFKDVPFRKISKKEFLTELEQKRRG
ncbi:MULTISPECIES: hypothetical protein [Bacillaceae]|uniref:hypothetical protein n=1 Tax=Bacillaceae TaxID=186817 RepID=UPI0018CF54B6|nr:MULTISPECIES: hypothetical protein [Bacillaceae]MBG9446724.1 hypothetical protein [Cytobacillus firmus]MCM3361268.1 hypothetical protein [Niallia sp. MER TA 168]